MPSSVQLFRLSVHVYYAGIELKRLAMMWFNFHRVIVRGLPSARAYWQSLVCFNKILQFLTRSANYLQHCDIIGWASEKHLACKKFDWCGAGVVICLEQGADDLHMVQLMSLPPHHLLLHENPEWFTFLVPACPGWKEAINGSGSTNNWECRLTHADCIMVVKWLYLCIQSRNCSFLTPDMDWIYLWILPHPGHYKEA